MSNKLYKFETSHIRPASSDSVNDEEDFVLEGDGIWLEVGEHLLWIRKTENIPEYSGVVEVYPSTDGQPIGGPIQTLYLR